MRERLLNKLGNLLHESAVPYAEWPKPVQDKYPEDTFQMSTKDTLKKNLSTSGS